MMRLESVYVKGLFSSYDLNIEFSKEGLTFIHSPNGIGKSTALKMIVDLFNGDAESLAATPFDSMTVTTDSSIISVRNDGTIKADIDGRDSDIFEVSGLLKVIYLSTDRLFVTENGMICPAIDVYGTEIYTRYQSAKNDSDLKMDENGTIPDIDDDKIVSLCRDIKARMDFISDMGINMKIPDGINFPPNRCDLFDDRDRYLAFVKAADEWVSRYYPFAESLSAYLDIINELFNDKKAVLDEEYILKIYLNNGKVLMPSKLSAGEKQILTIFYRLLFHCEEGSVAIIDEPEISLHVSWQQRIGVLFDEISRIRNIQIIVATHSPQIIHDMWDQAVELRPERA